MTGQITLSDWFPDCIDTDIPEPKKPKRHEDIYDPEYRKRKCGECSVVYASRECFEKECAEYFHPVDPWKNRKKPIVEEKKRRNRNGK